MPVKTSYTESELADFILGPTCLGRVARALSWRVQADVQSIIDKSLRDYGSIETIDEATDAGRLERITRIVSLQTALVNLRALYDVSGGGDSFARSQMQSLEKDLDRLMNTKIGVGRALGVSIITGDFAPQPITPDPRGVDI